MREALFCAVLICLPVVAQQDAETAALLQKPMSYQIPLLNGNAAAHGKGHAYVRIQLPGRDPEQVLVDTGSVGLILPASELNHPAGTPGFIRYSSSGIGYKGVWTKVRVMLSDAKPQNVLDQEIKGVAPGAVAELEVFAAQERTCDEGTPHSNCAEVMKKPIAVHMLGIGFGRSAESATPERNLFLMLDPMVQGVMPRGYRFVQNEQLVVGATEPVANLNQMCQFQQLKPSTQHKGDWQTSEAVITINGKSMDGTVLFDTGIEDSLVAADGMPTAGAVADGTKVRVVLKGTQYGVSFTVGSSKMPIGAKWIMPSHGNFVNTGYAPLADLDYFFNATDGHVGFCRRWVF